MSTIDNDALLKRLRFAEGHLRGIQKMIGNGAYCIDVINQLTAVQRALQKVSGLILDRHLHTCVLEAVHGDDAEKREKVLGEISRLFDHSGKR